MSRHQSGAAGIGALLLLLALVGAAGAWNYQRNLEAENAEPRPYRGLAAEDLEALGEALEGEVAAYAKRYGAASGRTIQVGGQQLLGEQVREFERVQSISESTRQLGRALSEREGSLQRVRKEQRRRETEGDAMQAFLRRLLTI